MQFKRYRLFYNFNFKHVNLISHLSMLFHTTILQSSPLMINKLPRSIPVVEDIIRDSQLQQERQLLTLIAQILHKLPLTLLVGIICKLIRNLIIIKLLVCLSRVVFSFVVRRQKLLVLLPWPVFGFLWTIKTKKLIYLRSRFNFIIKSEITHLVRKSESK